MKDYVLYDSFNLPDYSEYLEYCQDLDISPDDEESNEYWQWVADTRDLEWEDFQINCEHSKEADAPVVIIGHLGLWNGNPEIKPARFDNLLDAIEACIDGMDAIKIEMEEGHVNVYGYHHDGTNYFEIYKLSEEGQKVFENDSELKDDYLSKWEDYLF